MRLFAIYLAFLSSLALLFTLSSASPARETLGSVPFAASLVGATWATRRCFEVEDSGVEPDSHD